MNTLILPVAGQSSRFNGTRPKWLLTMPDGQLMIEKSIQGISLNKFDRIIVVALNEHIIKYSSYDKILKILKNGIRDDVELLPLDSPTKSQVETISTAIRLAKINGAIFIKDCDNTFELDYQGGNCIATIDLHTVGNVNAANKSYVKIDALGIVRNIVEKHVISNNFCCGGYGFQSVEQFLFHSDKLSSQDNLYLSHLIFSMILDGIEFQTLTASHYYDWGTLNDFRAYCERYVVIFSDVDGVLFENSSKFSPDGWNFIGIEKNLLALKKIQDNGCLHLIITTSRPPELQPELEKALAKWGITAHNYIMGLPHTARYLVNDFSATNPYPTAIAINLERDSDSLDKYLQKIL